MNLGYIANSEYEGKAAAWPRCVKKRGRRWQARERAWGAWCSREDVRGVVESPHFVEVCVWWGGEGGGVGWACSISPGFLEVACSINQNPLFAKQAIGFWYGILACGRKWVQQTRFLRHSTLSHNIGLQYSILNLVSIFLFLYFNMQI